MLDCGTSIADVEHVWANNAEVRVKDSEAFCNRRPRHEQMLSWLVQIKRISVSENCKRNHLVSKEV